MMKPDTSRSMFPLTQFRNLSIFKDMQQVLYKVCTQSIYHNEALAIYGTINGVSLNAIKPIYIIVRSKTLTLAEQLKELGDTILSRSQRTMHLLAFKTALLSLLAAGGLLFFYQKLLPPISAYLGAFYSQYFEVEKLQRVTSLGGETEKIMEVQLDSYQCQ